MNAATDRSDEDLLSLLRHGLDQADPVPPEVYHAARGSLAWRTVDAELAQLVEDSADAPVAGVRGVGDGPRLLTFQAGDALLVVEVVATGAARRLAGQLLPAAPARLEVTAAGGTAPPTEADVDALGRFIVAGVPAGPLRLTCRFHAADRPAVSTAWVSV